MNLLFFQPFLLVLALNCVSCAIAPALSETVFVVVEQEQLSLSLSFSMDDEVREEVDGWPARFEIKNNGANELSFLPWGTPWEGFLTRDIFNIQRSGLPVVYTGPTVKRRAPEPGDYLLLKPGQALSSDLDISSSYDVSLAGEYSISYRQGSLSLRYSGVEKIVIVPDTAPANVQIQSN